VLDGDAFRAAIGGGSVREITPTAHRKRIHLQIILSWLPLNDNGFQDLEAGANGMKGQFPRRT
jgi:hypothetical protein